MDIVGGEGAVGEGFEEEAYAFQEVVFWVYDGAFHVSTVAVEEGGNFREEAEFVHGWFWGNGLSG